MPIYPALALLLGSAIATGGVWVNRGTRFLSVIAGLAAAACFVLIFLVRHVPTPGDISSALSQHPSAYTLALGHMLDLTLESFAYLRVPLAIAGVAFLDRRVGNNSLDRMARGCSDFVDDGPFPACGAAGHGHFRSILVIQTACRCDPQVASRQTDHGRSVLHIFIHLFLYRPERSSLEWPLLQS